MSQRRWIPACAGVTLLLWGALAGATDALRKRPAGTEFLPVDLAFELQPLFWRDDGTVEVSWRIAKGYYLYRDKLKIAAVAPSTLKLGTPALPKSQPYEDEHFGKVEIYRDDLFVRVPLDKKTKGKVSLKITYQGCADAGLCYPPQTRTLEATR
jgi:thiol:disulfide interchange protein DsbD